jgi:hypothetical protein
VIKLGPDETSLSGQWALAGDQIVPDEVAKRIQFLIKDHLVQLATDPTGWDVLYRDPADGRFWELSYPSSELHGGGPPQLTLIDSSKACDKYKLTVDAPRQGASL